MKVAHGGHADLLSPIAEFAMLIIMKSQLQVWDSAVRSQFQIRLLNHARSFSPRRYQALGRAQIMRVVDLSVDKARSYGFTRQGPVQFYLDLMLLFGSGVDSDPQYPRLVQILQTGGEADQMARAEQLHKEVLTYLNGVYGPQNRYLSAALKRLARWLPTSCQTPADNTEETETPPNLLGALHDVYPEKEAYTGHVAVELILAEALRKAEDYSGRRNFHDAALLAALMFTFGHHCDRDPLYPWIATTLSRPNVTGARNRMAVLGRLYRRWLTAIVRDDGVPLPW